MATHNLLAVSANRQEPAINTEQELDTTPLAANAPNDQAVKVANREEIPSVRKRRTGSTICKVAGTLAFLA